MEEELDGIQVEINNLRESIEEITNEIKTTNRILSKFLESIALSLEGILSFTPNGNKLKQEQEKKEMRNLKYGENGI